MSNIDKKYARGEYSKHLRNFINNTLKEEGLNSYELSRKIGCSDMVLGSFIEGKTNTLNSKAVVALADYKKVSLDEVVGREVKGLLREIKLIPEKDTNIIKKDEQKIPTFLSKLSDKDQLLIKQIAGKFNTTPQQLSVQEKDTNKYRPNKEPSKQNKRLLKPREPSR